MFGLGFGEVILVLVIALIFVGPQKLPELAKGLAKGFREFQKATDELKSSGEEFAQSIKQDVQKDLPQDSDISLNKHSSHQNNNDKLS
jgi:sec-independent protein translocase protein TatA